MEIQTYHIQAGDYSLVMGEQHIPLVMGILNVTPDSFSDGGEFVDIEQAVAHAQAMQKHGADIIDIGGESSRPGAKTISAHEELSRIIPVIEALTSELAIPISIDTYKPEVAEKAVAAGASIINDICALSKPGMLEVARDAQVPVVLMHMQGQPQTMQQNPHYTHLIDEIYDFFLKKIQFLEQNGIRRGKVIIDPGIGFGKTVNHNYQILQQLRCFSDLKVPILVGPSRKAFLGAALKAEVNDRLLGTAAACTAAVLNGASIVRVHDVYEMKQIVTVAQCIKEGTVH